MARYLIAYDLDGSDAVASFFKPLTKARFIAVVRNISNKQSQHIDFSFSKAQLSLTISFPTGSSLLNNLSFPSGYASALDQSNQNRYHSDHQKNVNETAHGVRRHHSQ
jgi:hypothetical protein